MHSTIDLSAHGAHYGHMAIPYSHNLGGWANLLVPIASLKNGSGPVVLCMAGNHGDEYPGQIAIMHLWRQLKQAEIKGQLILIPCLNPPAALNMTRLSPLDGKNFNRCFPGDPAGAVSEILAHYLSTELFPRAEVVIDLHTGGRSLTFVPTAHMHLVPAGPQRAAMLAATEAFLTDTAFLYADVAGTGLLPVEAERQGKIVVTTEMGGGEIVPASTHQLCQRGLRNVLIHLGVLNGEPEQRKAPARWVQSLDKDDYRFAPESGLYETCIDLGGEVRAGDLLGRIHFIERPDRDPIEIAAHANGMIIAGRGPSIVKQGDCIAVIAHDTDPRTLP